eukprot:2262499-Pyramimonas_sp.AAC.1
MAHDGPRGQMFLDHSEGPWGGQCIQRAGLRGCHPNWASPVHPVDESPHGSPRVQRDGHPREIRHAYQTAGFAGGCGANGRHAAALR